MLPTAEQDIWIAWEYTRREQQYEQVERILELSRDDQHRLSAERIMANAMIALLEQG